ncbi:MAG: hypothetical protein JNK71_12420, partial [Methyloversatilis sp.]|nr:hypothetical protein [Methyloversatilis sp.]
MICIGVPIRSLLASLLAGILLLTLISPHFGWEAAAGNLSGSAHVAAQDAGGDPFHGCEEDVSDADGHHNHGCAGDQFSHIPVQVSAPLGWHPELTRQRIAMRRSSD